jgi:hypothetical protein
MGVICPGLRSRPIDKSSLPSTALDGLVLNAFDEKWHELFELDAPAF